ncbi:MAG: glycosyltransferase [Bacteroidales bacterium]
MRILQLCHKIPFPPSDGGAIAMNQLTRGLLDKGEDVKVLALAPVKAGQDPNQIPEDYAKETSFEAFTVDTRVRPWPAFLNLFTSESYNISRFFCPEIAAKLTRLLEEEEFDIIQLEGLFLTPYIPVIRKKTGAPMIFRSHNIEHFIWERMAKSEKNPLKKVYLKFLARRLKIFELKTVHQVDGLVAISPVDKRFFVNNGFSHPAITIPVTVDADLYNPGNITPDPGTVFHLGSMDWRPNQEGIRWFLDEVWPRVIERDPSLRFHLAGKNIPESFTRYSVNQVQVDGMVPDAIRYMASRELMVVPLRSGGGMRVKIIEGMAAGKAIVSTSIGAEGIDCSHGENIFLADTPAEMAEAILYCLSNKVVMQRMGRQAREFVKNHHSTEPAINKLIRFYHSFADES